MAFEPCRDLSAADWLVDAGRHEPWGRLVGLGPAGYEAYARLRFLPDPTGPGQDEADAPDEDPRHAEPDALWVAADVLAAFTSTPDDAYLALWEGWGLENTSTWCPRTPTSSRRPSTADARRAPASGRHDSTSGSLSGRHVESCNAHIHHSRC